MANLRVMEQQPQAWAANGVLPFVCLESDLIRGIYIVVRGTATIGAAGVLPNHFPRGLIRNIEFRSDRDNIKLMDALSCSYVAEFDGHRAWTRGIRLAAEAAGLIEQVYHVRFNPDELAAADTQRRYEYLSQGRRNVRVVVTCGAVLDIMSVAGAFTGTVSLVTDKDLIPSSFQKKAEEVLVYRHEETIVQDFAAAGTFQIPLPRDGYLRRILMVSLDAAAANANIGVLDETNITEAMLIVPRGTRPLQSLYAPLCACYRADSAHFDVNEREFQEGVAMMHFDQDGRAGAAELIDLAANQTVLQLVVAAAGRVILHPEYLRRPNG